MHKCNLWRTQKDGFVLPTVLIVSVIMLSALTLSLSIVWSSRQSLKEQFDTQNARNAAISGTNVAEGCRYGNILISDTITASSSPLGTRDCGMTSATASINPFILRPEYGNALTSFGFSATFLKDASGSPVSVSSTSGAKGKSSTAFARQGQLRATDEDFFVPMFTPGGHIQTITKAACPTELTQVKDARDNHSYYIKKLADGNCWMLTNLAYAGGTSNGGSNTYNDVIDQGTGAPGTPKGTLNNGTSDSTRIFTEAKYYIPPGANPTIDPTPPSTSTTGTGQYGYLYNWCAAMGGQNTAACANATTPAPIPTTNICPAGWRLPTGEATTGEFTALNTAINAGSTSSDAGLLTSGLFQRSGYWYNGFNNQGSYGYYWSSTQYSATSARSLVFGSTLVYPVYYYYKYNGFAVRCVAE